MKKLKTHETLQKVKNLLEKIDVVKVNDFELILNENHLHSMNFYYFVYAGCFEKLRRGVYKKTVNFYTKTIPEIYRISTDMLLTKRAIKKNEKNKSTVINPNIVSGENLETENLILILKSRGFKVLKECKTWEEI